MMNALPIRIHTAQSTFAGQHGFLRRLGQEVVDCRHLAWEMMKRDLKGQYRTSVLGILVPLLSALTTGVWAILFRDAHLINVGTIHLPYPFFVLCGMMLWATFLESIDAPISGAHAEQGLLSKANIPPEAVTLARLGQVLVNFVVKAVLIALAAALYRVHVPWTIFLAPLGLLLIVALGASVGLIVAPMSLLYTDIPKALPIITTFWFFITPVIFAAPTSGLAFILMRRINPMTPLLTTTRELAFGGGFSMPVGMGGASIFTICLLSVGVIFYRIAMPIVVDRANA